MSVIKFFLFGKMRIETDSKVIQKFESHKAEELLGYLLLNRDQPQSREKIADELWGDIALGQSKAYLRKALWQLQSILDSFGGRGILHIDEEYLQVNSQFNFWLDISVLEKAFKSTQGISGRDLEEVEVKGIRDAEELYRGELLEGLYLDWCLYEREHLQYLYLALLDKLIDYCETHKEFEKGIAYGERILYHDKAHERTHRWLMRLHYLAGDRTSALRQYHKCAIVLHEELNVEPAKETRLLYEMICKDRFEDNSLPLKTTVSKVDKEHLTTVLHHLNSFHRELSQIQNKLAQDMKFIQKTIKSDHN